MSTDALNKAIEVAKQPETAETLDKLTQFSKAFYEAVQPMLKDTTEVVLKAVQYKATLELVFLFIGFLISISLTTALVLWAKRMFDKDHDEPMIAAVSLVAVVPGVMSLVALVALFNPTRWMAAIDPRIGMVAMVFDALSK